MSLLYTAGTRSVLLLDAHADDLRVYASLTGLHVINRRRLNDYTVTQKTGPTRILHLQIFPQIYRQRLIIVSGGTVNRDLIFFI